MKQIKYLHISRGSAEKSLYKETANKFYSMKKVDTKNQDKVV